MKIQLDEVEKEYKSTNAYKYSLEDNKAIHPFSNITENDICSLSQIELESENFDKPNLEKSEIAIASSPIIAAILTMLFGVISLSPQGESAE